MYAIFNPRPRSAWASAARVLTLRGKRDGWRMTAILKYGDAREWGNADSNGWNNLAYRG